MNVPDENTAAEGDHLPTDTKRKRVIKPILAVLAVLLVASQFVPVELSNPPVEIDIPAPVEVKAILKRAC